MCTAAHGDGNPILNSDLHMHVVHVASAHLPMGPENVKVIQGLLRTAPIAEGMEHCLSH